MLLICCQILSDLRSHLDLTDCFCDCRQALPHTGIALDKVARCDAAKNTMNSPRNSTVASARSRVSATQVACAAMQRWLRLVWHSCALYHILDGYRSLRSYTTMPTESNRRTET